MAYGKIKADTFVYDNSGSDAEVTVASLGNKASLPASAGTVGASEVVQVDANKDITGFRNVTLSGNLQVNGTTTTVASSTMTVTDKNIEIAKGAANDAAADGAGITVDSGDGDKTWNWVDATDAWTSSEHIHLGDAKKLLLGAGSDLEIYHSNTNSTNYIAQSAGSLDIRNTGGSIDLRGTALNLKASDGSETMGTFTFGGAVDLYFDNSKKLETTTAGVTVTGTVTDSKGELRNIPQLSKSAAHVIVAADSGKHIFSSTGGWTLNASTDFPIGDAVTLINNSGSDQTLTVTGATCYNAADAATGNRTLAARGMATLICVAADTYHISGAGLS